MLVCSVCTYVYVRLCMFWCKSVWVCTHGWVYVRRCMYVCRCWCGCAMTLIFSVQVHAVNVDCSECSSLHDLALLSPQSDRVVL